MSKIKRNLIERIGLDRMVIAGFRILHIDFEKLKKHQNVTVEEQGKLTYLLDNGKSFRWLKIIDNKWFGTLTSGTRDNLGMKQDYSRMDITIGNRETGNLQNMTVVEYKERVERIFSYLHEEYGIIVDVSTVKINNLEINCTFIIKQEFYKYHRALRLLMFNLPSYYLKLGDMQGRNHKNTRLESETFYCGNGSMEIKIYDKKRQLQQLRGFVSDDNLMRIEIVLKNSRKIKEVFGTNKLNELTDTMVNQYYITQFHKLFEKRYHLWKIKNGDWLKQAVELHKIQSVRCWQRNLLNECRNYEQMNLVPILLDIDDLLGQIKMLERGGHYKRVEKSILKKCEDDDIYLQKDAEKILEIFDKVNGAYEQYVKNCVQKSPESPVCGEIDCM